MPINVWKLRGNMFTQCHWCCLCGLTFLIINHKYTNVQQQRNLVTLMQCREQGLHSPAVYFKWNWYVCYECYDVYCEGALCCTGQSWGQLWHSEITILADPVRNWLTLLAQLEGKGSHRSVALNRRPAAHEPPICGPWAECDQMCVGRLC